MHLNKKTSKWAFGPWLCWLYWLGSYRALVMLKEGGGDAAFLSWDQHSFQPPAVSQSRTGGPCGRRSIISSITISHLEWDGSFDTFRSKYRIKVGLKHIWRAMWAWVNNPLPMIPSYISSLVAFDVQSRSMRRLTPSNLGVMGGIREKKSDPKSSYGGIWFSKLKVDHTDDSPIS